MTDNEIIKALECCNNCDCKCCPCNSDSECKGIDDAEILDLINRQQAEIDILKEENEQLYEEVKQANEYNEALRVASIKEFAERVKRELYAFVVNPPEIRSVINNLVEEMVGESDDR